MKKRILTMISIGAFLMVSVGACGGGGGSNPAPPSKAVVKISTTGTLAPGTQIGGVNVSFDLPDGVTVKAHPDTINPLVSITDTGVVVASGVTGTNATAFATYTPAAAGAAGRLDINVYKNDGSGFSTGEFVTVNCDITPGASVTADSVGQVDYTIVDTDGAPISGISPASTIALH